LPEPGLPNLCAVFLDLPFFILKLVVVIIMHMLFKDTILKVSRKDFAMI